MLRGELLSFAFDSRAFKGNRLGLPTRREGWVYLPPGFPAAAPYRAILMLPGFGASHWDMLAGNPWKRSVPQQVDAAIAEDRMPPTLICAVDTWAPWGGTQFVDSEATAPVQQMLADELPALIRARFHASRQASGWGLAGVSSGGFGALRMLIDRPGRFGAAVCHAPDAHFELSLRPLLPRLAQAAERAGGLLPFCRQLGAAGPADQLDFEASIVAATVAAYAPDLRAGWPFFRLPTDPATGLVDQATWRRMQQHDPLVRLDAQPDALEGVTFLRLDAGTNDEFGLNYAAQELAKRLTSLPALRYALFEGGHRGLSRRYAETLPELSLALTA